MRGPVNPPPVRAARQPQQAEAQQRNHAPQVRPTSALPTLGPAGAAGSDVAAAVLHTVCAKSIGGANDVPF